MTEQVKPNTTFVSEGPEWVEIDSDNNEISRTRKPTFDTGHPIKTFAIYAGTLVREISGHLESTPVGIMAVPGGKLFILKDGEQIHLDAKVGEDFEFDRPVRVIEEAPSDYEEETKHNREKIADFMKTIEEYNSSAEKNAIVGVDILAELIAAEQIDIKPEDAKVEIFHGNGNHSDDGCMVIYDDSKVLKLKKNDILKMVKSKQLPGFVIKPDQVVSLLFLSLQARGALMSPKISMESRYAIASEMFDFLEEIGII